MTDRKFMDYESWDEVDQQNAYRLHQEADQKAAELREQRLYQAEQDELRSQFHSEAARLQLTNGSEGMRHLLAQYRARGLGRRG